MKIVLSYCEDPLTLSRASAACKTWNAVLADPTNSKMWFDFHNFARLKGPVLKYHRPLGWPKTGSSYTLAALLAPRSNEDAAGTLRALRSCHRMTKEELAVTINYDAKESKNFDHGGFGFWGGDHDDIMSDYEVGYLAYAGGVNIGTAGCQLICVDSGYVVDSYSEWNTTLMLVAPGEKAVSIVEFNDCGEGDPDANTLSDPTLQKVANLLGTTVEWSDADLIATIMHLCGGCNCSSGSGGGRGVPSIEGISNCTINHVHAIITDDPEVTAASKQGFPGYELVHANYEWCPHHYYMRGIDKGSAPVDPDGPRRWE